MRNRLFSKKIVYQKGEEKYTNSLNEGQNIVNYSKEYKDWRVGGKIISSWRNPEKKGTCKKLVSIGVDRNQKEKLSSVLSSTNSTDKPRPRKVQQIQGMTVVHFVRHIVIGNQTRKEG